MADRHRPLFNVTISNVPGPPFPLYSIGARMVANFPVGPIMDGGGLNMTVMSYLDQLDFGLQACPDVLPDIWSSPRGCTPRSTSSSRPPACSRPRSRSSAAQPER